MATSWPPERPCPTEPREHAAHLSKYLNDALTCVENAGDQPIPARIVKSMILSLRSLVTKVQHMPDVGTLNDSLQTVQAEARTTAEKTTQMLCDMKQELHDTKTQLAETTHVVEDTKIAARGATEMGRTVLTTLREMKSDAMQNQTGGIPSYAAMAARGLTSSIHNATIARPSKLPVEREIIVNVRDPMTVASLRAMNPRNLKAHVDRAIAQSTNEHVSRIKAVSANQLKSGDLSIRTADASSIESLRQFAEDWAGRIGQGASAQVPTYGVLAHGIRTSTMDMTDLDKVKRELLQDNKPFIPTADIKHVKWLARRAPEKFMSSVVIEFSKPGDANKIIDEGLIWQGEVFHCERYDRGSRLRQCYHCQTHGHIGTQCKASIACGYCAQEHSSRDCPNRANESIPRKCAACQGTHVAWSSQCSVRREELAKVKAAYSVRPTHHHIPGPAIQETTTRESGIPTRTTEMDDNRNTRTTRATRVTRSISPPKRGPKRVNTGIVVAVEKENEMPAAAEGRTIRVRAPSRRVMEEIEVNTQLQLPGSRHAGTSDTMDLTC